MKLVAKTVKGSEFIHSKKEAFFAPDSSAKKMADMMNVGRYHLENDGQVWNVYDYDFTQEEYVFFKLFLTKGNLKARRIR